MKPETLPLLARRNAPFAQVFSFYENGSLVDTTGAVARMQVRLYGAAPNDSLIDLYQVSGLLEQGLIVADGKISVFIYEDTLNDLPRGIPGQSDEFVYDLLVEIPSEVEQVWMQGKFTVKPGVTKREFLTDEGGDILTDESDIPLMAD